MPGQPRPEDPSAPAPPAAGAVPGPERPERARPRGNAVVGVGVVVTDPAGRVLLGQGPDGRWELPGGKVDPGEGFADTAVRELAEETSLRAEPAAVRILAVLLGDKAGVTLLTAAAVAGPVRGRPRVTEPDKILRWEWFAPEEVPTGLYGPSAAVLRAWRSDLPVPPAPGHAYPLGR
ncbi:NUDIX hydrolase [Streptomyces sp. NPDC097619]|uniref:nucleotide triphosphate diphosphatase NUDT15 n=1 Tax=Streptomyces sp. NPDC097619 TaxID=3157228 RepID=UPI00331BEA20